MAHDASHYLLTPQAVVTPRTPAEVAALFRAASDHGLPLTFRSGGTSLSGQATANGILVDTRRHFRDIEVLDDGAAGPGTPRRRGPRGQHPARPLRPQARPRPGQRVGLHHRRGRRQQLQRHGLRHRAQHLPRPSTRSSSCCPAAPCRHRRAGRRRPAARRTSRSCYAGLLRLRDRVRADPASVAEIRRLYAIKNTMGYGVNSFVDHDRPADDPGPPGRRQRGHPRLRRRGDLPDGAGPPARRHRLADLRRPRRRPPRRCRRWSTAGFATIELLDATSLRVGQQDPQASEALRRLAVVDHTALLVEYQEPTRGRPGRAGQCRCRACSAELPLILPAELSSDADGAGGAWHIRKGLYAAVAGPGRPAPPRCWRTSPSRSSGCCRPARR